MASTASWSRPRTHRCWRTRSSGSVARLICADGLATRVTGPWPSDTASTPWCAASRTCMTRSWREQASAYRSIRMARRTAVHHRSEPRSRCRLDRSAGRCPGDEEDVEAQRRVPDALHLESGEHRPDLAGEVLVVERL